jgi:hypothetical protein
MWIHSSENCISKPVPYVSHIPKGVQARPVELAHNYPADNTVFETDRIATSPSTPVYAIPLDPSFTELLSEMESRLEAEPSAFVALVSSPSHDEGLHATQELVVEGGNGRQALAVDNVDGEFGWVIAVGCFVHFAALVVNLLAGQEEAFAWWCCLFVELDGAILVRFGSVDEIVDLVASLGGEFEENAVVLSICCL